MTARLVSLCVLAMVPGLARADAFDRYTNEILKNVPKAAGVREIAELTPKVIADHDRVLKNLTGAFVVVKTNDDRWSKLLIQESSLKFAEDKQKPAFLVERYTTFKDGQERAVFASGQNLCLFDGFLLNLDFGQIVPADATADLKCSLVDGTLKLATAGKAKMYLLTKPMPEAEPKKGDKLEVGENFEARYFNGTYQLHDDGRRSGKLVLKVDDEGAVTGKYFSDKGGDEYEVLGKVGPVKHAIQFTIKFRQSEQAFQGMMFTGNAQAIAGTAKLQNRETAFYAVRAEDK